MDPTNRGSTENQVLNQLVKSSLNKTDPSSMYVFDAKWTAEYTNFLKGASPNKAQPPKMVDNRPIEEKIKQNTLTPDDYFKVSEDASLLIYLLYRGGPVMTEKNIEEMKEDQRSRLTSSYNSPYKMSKDSKELEMDMQTDLSKATDQSCLSNSYAKPKKTKSWLEQKYCNKKGWVPEQQDILDDSRSILYCKHRGDSPARSMDEEERSIQQRSNQSSIRSDSKPGSQILHGLNIKQKLDIEPTPRDHPSKKNIEHLKAKLQDYIDKNKQFYKSNEVDLPKEAKNIVFKKIVEVISEPTSHNDPHQQDFLVEKYSNLKKKPYNHTINGLENTKVYCYLNSVLQMLFSINEIMTFFSELSDAGLKSRTTCSEFKKIANLYQNNNKKLIDATGLLNCFRSKFHVNSQQDVDELLRLLLDQLHQELKPPKKKIPQEANSSKFCWQTFCKQEDSVLTYLFTGETKRKTVCLNCLHESEVRETFDILSLSLTKESTSLSEVISSNFEAELIERGYQCSGCKRKAPATSKLFLTKLPRYLIIQLKRFQVFPTPCKNSQELKYDTTDKLDLAR